ncbi:DNA topoisomerase IB [Burkholderia dolosa]|uniref:DNA topoisomerase n=1 Tax=Burkholderia dolosa TaxID=152500 RepID=A0A892I6Q0_9BURK|nr:MULTISPECIES: DNA topoisomerase IB [Burkholderia]AKE01626.1 DNA topoisomerase [Burkholderia cepacia]AJY11345.1 eukaryotic DNA topoisomerase I, catalytic core family protein [Burkholderia dolosa AU0158]AYZ95959.1 DNA topoisomerase IB [Burkholderia dolosa]ETP61324.1 DNA topoisomerase [Burkholderia dolosa PC543]MBR8420743.1 DNA topoisomerase IB [Burkholderia dolosa]
MKATDDRGAVKLRYVDDRQPGYTRRRVRNGFAYYKPNGERIRDADEIARINALAIPPAYTDVWICADPRGHLQATGRDARGRKQYRYHPLWRETRDANKYARMAAFARALPRIRAHVARDLALPGMPRDKIVATIVRLLDTTFARVGNAEYARENASYGLTTLRKRHVTIRSGQVRLRFTGKSGIEHDVTVDDPRVSRIVRRCAELHGHELFQYVDEHGERHTVGSSDVNDYLRDAGGAEFTAKDYRTWAGSVQALALLRRTPYRGVTHARKQIVETVRTVADMLRNTPAVCRRCYIHPAVLDAFESGTLDTLEVLRTPRGLRVDEAAFAALLALAARRAPGHDAIEFAALRKISGRSSRRSVRRANCTTCSTRP